MLQQFSINATLKYPLYANKLGMVTINLKQICTNILENYPTFCQMTMTLNTWASARGCKEGLGFSGF